MGMGMGMGMGIGMDIGLVTSVGVQRGTFARVGIKGVATVHGTTHGVGGGYVSGSRFGVDERRADRRLVCDSCDLYPTQTREKQTNEVDRQYGIYYQKYLWWQRESR